MVWYGVITRLFKFYGSNESVDGKKILIAMHFIRLTEGNCNADVSPYLHLR
jgi:hypothetical protein